MERARGHIPGNVLEIRYNRNGTYYKHEFRPGVRQRINPDGSVTLYHPRRRVWANDTEPDFWSKYGDRHTTNPRGGVRMAKSTNWMPWLLIGGAVLLLMKPSFLGGLTLPGTGAAGSQPVNWWIAPTGDTTTLKYAPGITPPLPGYRPASEWELSQGMPSM
jgi:hypothetical protein